MMKMAYSVLKHFDFRDINIARKWFVNIVGDTLILAFALFLGYTLKTFFI